jgi:ribosome-associated translation inhibitor RaiA
LYSAKDEIETKFGGPLNWQRLDDKSACRISIQLDNGGIRDEESWPEIQDAMIDAMIRLERALKPNISKLII